MKKQLRLLSAVLVAFLSIANVQAQVNSTAQWYCYAESFMPVQDWNNAFINFSMQDPTVVQQASEVFPETYAAAYVDGYVWFIVYDNNQPKDLCKAPLDNETHTIGAYETVMAGFEPATNLVLVMSYNPADDRLYYIDMFNTLKCFSPSTPEQVSTIGTFTTNLMITLAINAEGEAYGIETSSGNLYQINLTDASVSLVGNIGYTVAEYAQSLAFDLETGELFWAKFDGDYNMGLVKVDPMTAESTYVGQIGGFSWMEVTGMFMVPEETGPEVISEIRVEGFTAPAWGEHPDFYLELPSNAHYVVDEVDWWYRYDTVHFGGDALHDYDIFDREDVYYQMDVIFVPEDGFVFDEDLTVYFNGDSSPFNPNSSYVMWSGKYLASTIYFQLTDPTGVTEQTQGSIAVWPNPAGNTLHLDIMEGETVSVFDMTGRMVKQERYEGKLDVSDLVSGIYAIKADGCTVKFMKE